MGTPKSKYAARFAEGYPSGQREQTVNLPAYAFEGSNPSPSTTEAGMECGPRGSAGRLGVISARGEFNGRTSAFQADDVGSIPTTRSSLSPLFSDLQPTQGPCSSV